jgi:hypothetical protein
VHQQKNPPTILKILTALMTKKSIKLRMLNAQLILRIQQQPVVDFDPIVEVIPPEPQPEEQESPRREVARSSYNPEYYSNAVD